ncbi:MAG: ABC-type transport system involved in cytochrome c biosis, permease component [Rickettsiaceae bacterium]|jgi:heme exporter protein B|nr:ABC-type transport system involved in cytochrome c biosis, permease component [Rickettsiaceae bacterium]
MSNAFFTIVKNDLKLACTRGGATINLLVFFIISAALFPFAIGSENTVLMSIGAGVIWVCALLASMLVIAFIFDEDYEDGTLANILLQGVLPEVLVLSRIFSNWLTCGLPLIVVTPLLTILFNIENQIPRLLISLLIGTPTLCVISTLAAALTLGLKKGGGLIGIIVLPLYIPVLIFGAVSNNLLLLGILFFMLPVGVLAAAAAIRAAVE